ncbi:carbohydrate ABC transporter permease [Paenibacillus abyssi]|uniref:Sugar ABC transporter permease n=1 Tax=Paenibacillus abyssi TaxID=1340531 RepID=A0A917CYG4_9BACL|nr:sugar ABC transporter permease [Paenibacillus abyssi]GGG03455.1 sugar ABC transporter permease [Paenibacillus abyssi]
MNSRFNRIAPYVFVLPNILVVVLFAIYPLIANFVLSFTEGSFEETTFVGFDNYILAFKDESFWISLRNTLYYTLLLVPPTIVLSLVIAVGLNRAMPLKNTIRAVYLLPYLLSWSVIGLIWRWIYSSNYGILNNLLASVGLPPLRWILDPNLTIPSLAFVGIWAGVGYYMMIYLAGLQGISGTYYEAAKIDGANKWQQFIYITVPSLRPITTLIVILAVTSSFRVFEQIYVMTGGGPGRASFVLVLYIFIKGFNEFSIGYAAALSVILFLILLVITILQQKLLNRDE